MRIEYPAELPIAAARAEIMAALSAHALIIVCGDTGSGKTTQLPKICLEAGRGERGIIGHTQPRRIAARAVAARLADEIGVEIGREVGYQVRFAAAVHAATRVKVMTDGILLNEIRADPLLAAYDTLIVDEAHERTLNIDFLLGYLKRVLARRNDLKVIVTSATIDPERFAAHFGGAPVLRIEGRSYPVDVRYAPPAPDEDLAHAVTRVACELAGTRGGEIADMSSREVAGACGGEVAGACGGELADPRADEIADMLVFLPGERWIRDAADALARHGPAGYEVLPLYARLAARDQDRIFKPGPKPRIVLATNVAETSLTVPRIRFVIDSGLARVSRYAARHRVQGLGVEPIAQANAVQRAGRSGRLAPGVCVRLYERDDFQSRPPFTDPEISRTELAGVILRLEALRLGPVDAFPFLDPPPDKAVNDAYRLLEVLGALDAERRLTRDGRLMGRLPLDPRLSRLLLASRRNRCLAEALILAAGLSVVDPREHPPEHREAAQAAHASFTDPRSDFMTLLNLWGASTQARRSGDRRLRAWCRERFVSAARLREWEDVHAQLAGLVRDLGWSPAPRATAEYASIHRALVAAFVDFVAERHEGTRYRGMHDARAALFPGSGVAANPPRWIVAAEHVSTQRPYFRTVARINPKWVSLAAPHLVRREHVDAGWDEQRGRATAREIESVFGLTLGRSRWVDYGRVDPVTARAIFIRDALAADRLGVPVSFLEHNRAGKRRLLEWEARTRSRDLFIGERGLEAFYAARLPADVRDRASLEKWLAEGPDRERALMVGGGDLCARDPASLSEAAYPSRLEVAGQKLPLEYRYEPGDPRDGITVTVPRLLVDALTEEQLDWLVPGRLRDKVAALLRTLPKDLRRALVPIPDTVERILPRLEARAGRQRLVAALAEALAEDGRVAADARAFDGPALAPDLSMGVEVVDETGAPCRFGRDLAALRRELGGGSGAAPERALHAFERRALSRADLPDLPDRVEVDRIGGKLSLYPALDDARGRVDLVLLPPGHAAVLRHRRGARRLLLRELRQQVQLITGKVQKNNELLLLIHAISSPEQLVDDVLAAAADEAFVLEPPIRTRAAFDACLAAGRADYVRRAERMLGIWRELMAAHRRIRAALANERLVPERARSDIDAQLAELLGPACLSETPVEWRAHLPRFLEAIEIRLAKLPSRGAKDAEYQAWVAQAWDRFVRRRDALPGGWPLPAELMRYRWLVEEFRVSLFAQQLGTSLPVSAKRLDAAWQEGEDRDTHR